MVSSQPIPQMPAARPAQPVSPRYAKARLSAALPSPGAPQSATPVTPAPCQPQPALNVTRSTPAAAGLRTYVNAPPPTPKNTPPRHPSYPRRRVSTPTTLAPQSQPKNAPPQPSVIPADAGVQSSGPTVPQTARKNAPPHAKSFLEKTLIRANPPHFDFAPQAARPSAPASLSNASLASPPFASCSARMLGHVLG